MKYIYTFVFTTLFFSCGSPQTFEDFTGLEITEKVSDRYSHDDYFAFEGERSIVFKTTASQIKKWITETPPWNNENWSRGLVKFPIGMAVQFNFPEGVGISGINGDSQEYSGDSNLVNLLTDTSNYYVFEEFCCEDLPFHNGRLLILQSSTSKVYYAHWDY